MDRSFRQIVVALLLVAGLYLLISNLNQLGQLLITLFNWLGQNGRDIFVNLIASLFWLILGIFALVLRRQIWQWLRRFFLTSEQRQKNLDREDSERLYLDSIRAKIRQDEPKWDTHLYVPLSAVESYNQIGFRPEMILVSRRLRFQQATTGEDGEEDLSFIRGKQVDLIDLLRRRERLVVLGEPGSGKSVALRQMALLAADEGRKHQGQRLPLVINLAGYIGVHADGTPQPVLTFLQQRIQAEMPRWGDFLVEHLEDYLAAGRLLILFDSLNQMPAEDYIVRLQQLKEFAGAWPRSKFIFTCRTFDYDPLFSIQEVIIRPLSERSIARFARNYLGVSMGRQFIDALKAGDPRVLKDCRVPYFLALAVGLFARDQMLPSTRAELFSTFTSGMVEAVAGKKGLPLTVARGMMASLLRPLAFTMNKARLLGTEVELTWLETILPGYSAEALALGREAGLLDITHQDRLRFAHHILQEYYAALELMEQLSRNDQESATYLTDPWWAETVTLLAGLTADPEQLVQRIIGRPERTTQDLGLAARCIAGSSIPHDSNTIQELLRAISDQMAASNVFVTAAMLRALGDLGDAAAIRLAEPYLQSKNPWLEETALLAVIASPVPEARRALLRYFRAKAPWQKVLSLIRSYIPQDQRLQVIQALLFRLGRVILLWSVVWGVSAILIPQLGIALLNSSSNWLSVIIGLLIMGAVVSVQVWVITLVGPQTRARVDPALAFSLSCLSAALLIFSYQRLRGYYSDFSELPLIFTTILAMYWLIFILKMSFTAIRALFGSAADRDRIMVGWTLSFGGWLLSAYLPLWIAFVAAVAGLRIYTVQNMLFVALDPAFPPTSRIMMGGWLLIAGALLVLPLPAAVLSSFAQLRAAGALLHLRQIERRMSAPLSAAARDEYMLSVEQIIRQAYNPRIVQERAILMWGRQFSTEQTLPLLIALSIDPRKPVASQAVAQKAIDEINTRWLRQPHEPSLNTQFSESLLAMAVSGYDLQAVAQAALMQWCQQAPPSEDKRLIQAALLQRDGKFDEADGLLGEPTWLEPDNIELHRQQLKTLFAARCFPRILTLLAVIVAAGARKNVLRQIFASEESDTEAIRRLTQSIEQHSERAVLYRQRAYHLINMKRFTEARTDIDRAAQLDPRAPWLQARQSQFYLYQGDVQHALDYLKEAIIADPLTNWYFHLGVVLLNIDQPEAAIATFRIAMQFKRSAALLREAREELRRLAPAKLPADIQRGIDDALRSR